MTTGTVKKQNKVLEVLKRMSRNKLAMAGLVIFTAEILLAVLAPVIAPYGFAEMDYTAMQTGPSAAHWFGTDEMGRDILSRLLYGSRYSLSVGLIAILLNTALGMVIGAAAGFFGGWVDNLIMRFLDVIQSLPAMLLTIVISAVLGPGYFNTILALSINGIPGKARMLRAQILKERNAEYIEASESINCSRFRTIFRHLIPNCFSPLIVQSTMGVATIITTMAGLSFIGLGVQPPTPEWGAMLSGSRQFIRNSPYMVIFPGLAIAVTVLALNLLGDGLRDALDPKLKR
ncbi:MAG: ABC transporter permease [Solobacterium sp.]|nr:ABC transporter permease [Solobacterium sp.]